MVVDETDHCDFDPPVISFRVKLFQTVAVVV